MPLSPQLARRTTENGSDFYYVGVVNENSDRDLNSIAIQSKNINQSLTHHPQIFVEETFRGVKESLTSSLNQYVIWSAWRALPSSLQTFTSRESSLSVLINFLPSHHLAVFLLFILRKTGWIPRAIPPGPVDKSARGSNIGVPSGNSSISFLVARGCQDSRLQGPLFQGTCRRFYALSELICGIYNGPETFVTHDIYSCITQQRGGKYC